MRDRPLDRDEFLTQLTLDPNAIELDQSGTLAMPVAADADADADADDLPLLISSDRRELALGDEIGRGGMGLVRNAQQVPLRREVAVKCGVRGSHDRHEVGTELVREARVTGALEHPNIVPVHTLGTNERGDVLLVMKRIEGRSWMEMLRARPDVMHELDRHLEILMEVCLATAFAHSRGVIHRDIKPDNVMVGAFGEVYVLDWGLAIAIHDRSIPGVPRASEVTAIAGTPHYMAPEMTVVDGQLDERTDTYLLGATLHAILTGHGPHSGTNVLETLHNAHVATPVQLGDDVPVELAGICRRALARDPGERFASAEQFRQAIGEFRRHASARDLCAQAQVHLARLSALVAAEKDDDLVAHRAFSAARFGFEAAEREWPGSLDARSGSLHALHAMARYELWRRHLDAATVLVDQLPAPARDVVEGVERLRAELAREAELHEQATRAAREIDLNPNQRRRAMVFLLCGVLWAGFGIASGILMRAGIHTPGRLELAAAHGVLAIIVLAVWPWVEKRVNTRADRSMFEAGLAILVGAMGMWLAVWYIGAPLSFGLAAAQSLTATASWALFALLDRRLLVVSMFVFLTAPAVLLLDRWAFDINGLTVGLALGYISWKWRGVPRDPNMSSP